MQTVRNQRIFPCPICATGLDVRIAKTKKPYVICDGCGMQMFVRVRSGIKQFEKLVQNARDRDIWSRLREMEQRYRLKCPKCGTWFWASEDLIETSVVNGSFKGYRCPNDECDGVAKGGNRE